MKISLLKYLAAILASVLLISTACAGIGSPPYNPANVAITGGTINGISGSSGDYNVIGSAAYRVNNTSGALLIDGFGNYFLNGSTHLLFSATAPTIASGFGTSAAIQASNGTAAFRVYVGTGGTAWFGVLTMPAAPTAWACTASPYGGSVQANQMTISNSTTTTSVQLESRLVSTGATVAWTTGTQLTVKCIPY